MATGKNLSHNELLDLFDPEIHYDENGNKIVAEFNNEHHCICIKFDKLLCREEIRQHNIFMIQFRRYYNHLAEIVEDLNILLNRENDSARLISTFNFKIAKMNAGSKTKKYPFEQFLKDIKNFFLYIKEDIVDYVDETYDLDLDHSTDKINKNLQVTDAMNKVYIESAMGMRIILPVICAYYQQSSMSEETEEQSLIFYKIFRIICKVFGDNEEDPKNSLNPLTKLSSIINSRLYSTKYNNKKIWKFLNNFSKDIDIIGTEYEAYIIENIIPKIARKSSSIKYLDSVIKNKIDYLFTYNYPFEYKPLKNRENDDDDSDERDRLNEMNFVSRKNEALLALNQLTIQDNIKYMIECGFTSDVIKQFKMENLHGRYLNEVQFYYLTQFYKYMNLDSIEVITEDRQIVMLCYMISVLDEDGFTEIVKILESSIDENYRPSKIRSSNKVINSKAYLEALKRYEDVTFILGTRHNFIKQMNEFSQYPYVDENNNPINIDDNALVEENTRFLKTYCF